MAQLLQAFRASSREVDNVNPLCSRCDLRGEWANRGYKIGGIFPVEITKALAALQPLYGKDNVEIVTIDGRRVRGTVFSLKTTQALTTPSVKMECSNGEIVKIPFPAIAEIKDHNH